MIDAQDQIEYLKSFSYLISAYEEIAANRMQKIRERVVYSRDYAGGLNNIFQQLKYSYKTKAEKYKKAALANRNGKTACVFISANSGLYGDLIHRIFHLFLEDWQREHGDAVVIGLWGKGLFENNTNHEPFTYFDFPDSSVDRDQLNKICDFLKPYQRVLVYHGLFRNIIRQDVAWSNISGDQLGPQVLLAEATRIIYEPSLEILLDFFEKEIFMTLFSQTVYESKLAKFSARMTALDTATQNIEKAAKIATNNALAEKHRLINKKQQATMTGRLI